MGEISYNFRWKEKLHSRRDFGNVLRKGRKFFHPAFLVYVYERNDGDEIVRLGLITSRKVGNAVERNYVKRRSREVFRTTKHLLKPGVDVAIAAKPPAVKLDFCSINTALRALWRKAEILDKTVL